MECVKPIRCARKYRPRLSKWKEQLHKLVPRQLQGRDSFNLGKERIGKVRALCIDLAYDTKLEPEFVVYAQHT